MECYSFPEMEARYITPILNVSDISASFAWFEKLGWRKCWDWGTPPTFGAVGSGKCEIFLCQGGQGGRGRGQTSPHLDQAGPKRATKAHGCRSGWTTSTKFTNTAPPSGSRSLSRRPTC